MPRLCSHCGARFETDVRHCPHDGAPTYWVRAEEELVGRVLDGRFTLVELLGHGGMGAVFRARQHSMDRDVAVKVMLREMAGNDNAVKRFLLEARAASRLSNPHTVTVFDFGQAPDGMLYLSMELLSGRPLSKELRTLGRPMEPARAVGIVDQVLDSLAEAHAQGIIHRDIKPDNVFLLDVGGGRDFVKVLDFGIAKILGDDSGLTVPGTGFGTPSYMSPEQARGAALDARSDLYSVGAMLFEMLTLRPPFVSRDPLALVMMKVNTPAPRPSDLNPEVRLPALLEDLVLQLLAVTPEQRPPDAATVKRMLEGVLSDRVVGSPVQSRAGGTTPMPAGTLVAGPAEAGDHHTTSETPSTPAFGSVFPTAGTRLRRFVKSPWVAAAFAGVVLAVAGGVWGLGREAPFGERRGDPPGEPAGLAIPGGAADVLSEGTGDPGPVGTTGDGDALQADDSAAGSEAVRAGDAPGGDAKPDDPASGAGTRVRKPAGDEGAAKARSSRAMPTASPARQPVPAVSSPAGIRLKRGTDTEPAARTRLKR